MILQSFQSEYSWHAYVGSSQGNSFEKQEKNNGNQIVVKWSLSTILTGLVTTNEREIAQKEHNETYFIQILYINLISFVTWPSFLDSIVFVITVVPFI